MNGPHWIKQWIADLALLNEQFRDDDGKIDFEALGREEVAFRTALMTHDFRKSKRAQETFEKAKAAYDACVENGKKGGRPKKDSSSTERDRESEQRVGGNSGQGLVTAPAAPSHKASAPSTRIAPAEPEVLNLAYSGEFANVSLTQEQYNDLLQHVGNMNDCKSLIDDFSASIADGSTKSDNHFATLKKWAKARKRFDSEKKEGAPTFQEREGKRQSEQLRKYGLLK